MLSLGIVGCNDTCPCIPSGKEQYRFRCGLPWCTKPIESEPGRDGFGFFIFCRFEETYFRNGVVKRPESKPRKNSFSRTLLWIGRLCPVAQRWSPRFGSIHSIISRFLQMCRFIFWWEIKDLQRFAKIRQCTLMVWPEQLPYQEPDFVKPIVGSRQHDEDFQSAEDHAHHLYDQGSVVGHWPRQANG